MNQNNTNQSPNGLENRLDWMDEQRQQTNRKVAEVTQQLELQSQELASRENRIKDLEKRLAEANSQINRLGQLEGRLSQLRDEMASLIEQNEERLRDSVKEQERLRRVEHETHSRELSEMRRQMPAIGRLQNELEQRKAEDARLANVIGANANQISQFGQRFDPINNELAYGVEISKKHTQRLTELEGDLLEQKKQLDDQIPRIDSVADKVAHADASIREVLEQHEEVRKTIQSWTEQVQLGEYERNNQLTTWERVMGEYRDAMNKYESDWVGYSDQAAEAARVAALLEEFQNNLGEQQRENLEHNRVEVKRLQNQWAAFVEENDKKWRFIESEIQQRRAAQSEREKRSQIEYDKLEAELERLKQENEMLWRVQTAQADALKQFPRLWLEEVERTMEQNPYRRRQPTMARKLED